MKWFDEALESLKYRDQVHIGGKPKVTKGMNCRRERRRLGNRQCGRQLWGSTESFCSFSCIHGILIKWRQRST